MNLLGWLIILFALLISVGLHEMGHLLTAKKFGMKATRYFIGMGPTVWSKTRGETEYGVKAFPIGGFVKIIGMTSIEDVDPADEPRAFRRAPAWQRVIVLSAGSFMHFLLATVLLFGLALFLGIENDNTTQLGTVSACLPASVKALDADAACTAADPKSPAAAAGLKPGDEITSFAGVQMSNYTQLETAIKDVPVGKTVPVTVRRDGHSLTLHATIASVKGRPGGFLGISGTSVFQRSSPLGALEYVGTGWSQTVTGELSGLGHIPADIPKLFDKKSAESGTGVTSMVGVAEVTGQAVASPVGWKPKVAFVVGIVTTINIFVGIFNLFPLLPLDGGHILAVFLEKMGAAWARFRRRPDPGMFDLQKLMPVSFSIFAVIVVFCLAVLISNIVYPVNIG